MLTQEIRSIIDRSRANGWVLEPDAKEILKQSGVPVPDFSLAPTLIDAVAAAERIGYPVVAKVVSAAIIHKSDVGGVAVGIRNAAELKPVFERFSTLRGFRGVLVEKMLTGLELIVGAVNDYQFGPVILMGIGGTGVEIYQDTVIRMAPVSEQDVQDMAVGLKGAELLKGYRGEAAVNLGELTRLVTAFSRMVMDLQEDMASIDLNPVKCNAERCVAADARIMLNPSTPD